VSGRLRYVKRTRQLWTCSCRWPSRSTDNQYRLDRGKRSMHIPFFFGLREHQ
jgi:hypothetical protein